jgi:2-polyprenyl-3-methyl-5-hydroxy-6-metoxy-1,4-benzoquinol methylase
VIVPNPIEAVATAQERGLHILQGDVEQPKILPGPFDAVLLMDVLEHLRDPEVLLRRLLSAPKLQRKRASPTVRRAASALWRGKLDVRSDC